MEAAEGEICGREDAQIDLTAVRAQLDADRFARPAEEEDRLGAGVDPVAVGGADAPGDLGITRRLDGQVERGRARRPWDRRRARRVGVGRPAGVGP